MKFVVYFCGHYYIGGQRIIETLLCMMQFSTTPLLPTASQLFPTNLTHNKCQQRHLMGTAVWLIKWSLVYIMSPRAQKTNTSIYRRSSCVEYCSCAGRLLCVFTVLCYAVSNKGKKGRWSSTIQHSVDCYCGLDSLHPLEWHRKYSPISFTMKSTIQQQYT